VRGCGDRTTALKCRWRKPKQKSPGLRAAGLVRHPPAVTAAADPCFRPVPSWAYGENSVKMNRPIGERVLTFS
jgi:hypothetical protein